MWGGFAFHAARVREEPGRFRPPVWDSAQAVRRGTRRRISTARELDQSVCRDRCWVVDLLVPPTAPSAIPGRGSAGRRAGSLYARNTRRHAYGCPPGPFRAVREERFHRSANCWRLGERKSVLRLVPHSNRDRAGEATSGDVRISVCQHDHTAPPKNGGAVGGWPCVGRGSSLR